MSRTGKNTSRSSPNGLEFNEDPWKQVIKRRRRFSIEETRILEEEYGKNPSPNQDKIQQIADIISTPRKIVTTWFQNRRAKNKRRERDSRREALRIRIRRTNTNTLSSQDSLRDDYDYDGDVDDIAYRNNYNLEPEDEEYYAGSSGSNHSTYYTTANNMNSNSQDIASIDDSFDFNLGGTTVNTLVTQPPNNMCQNIDTSLVSTPPPHNSCQHPHTFVSQAPINNNNQYYNTNLPQANNQQFNINVYANMNNFFQSPGMNQHQPFNFFHHPQQQYQPEYPYNSNNNDNSMNRAVMPFFMMNNNYNNFSSPVNNDDSNAGLCINPVELFLNFYPQQQQQQPRGQIQEQGEEEQDK